MHPYHTLFAFLYVFAISTVTMETLFATTLVRSNVISAISMWTAFVLVWGAFIYILTFFKLAIKTRFAFTSETSGSISTHGISVVFTIFLKRLKKIIMIPKITFTTVDTIHWRLSKFRRSVSFNDMESPVAVFFKTVVRTEGPTFQTVFSPIVFFFLAKRMHLPWPVIWGLKFKGIVNENYMTRSDDFEIPIGRLFNEILKIMVRSFKALNIMLSRLSRVQDFDLKCKMQAEYFNYVQNIATY